MSARCLRPCVCVCVFVCVAGKVHKNSLDTDYGAHVRAQGGVVRVGCHACLCVCEGWGGSGGRSKTVEEVGTKFSRRHTWLIRRGLLRQCAWRAAWHANLLLLFMRAHTHMQSHTHTQSLSRTHAHTPGSSSVVCVTAPRGGLLGTLSCSCCRCCWAGGERGAPPASPLAGDAAAAVKGR